MKAIILSVFFTNITFAYNVTCNIKSNDNNEININHNLSLQGHGPLNRFESENITGFITSANGYLVISVTNQDNGNTNNFYGNPQNGNAVGGGIISSNNYVIEINCK